MEPMRIIHAISILTAVALCGSSAEAQMTIEKPPHSTTAPSKFRSAEDGWLDVSGFLDEKYGFLPVVIPITEPAVGYGAAAGLAFISQPFGDAKAGFGRRRPSGQVRLGESTAWAGLGYVFAVTRVTFDAPAGTPGLPDFRRDSKVGGLTPSFTYDTRDNLFTPTRGTFVETVVGVFSHALGGDDEFQRVQLIAMQFVPLFSTLYLGLRGDGAASFGDVPFYLRPFISLRGAPLMRYQGDEVAQVEAELRWQFWRRFSLVGFAGGGAAWTELARFQNTKGVVTGGVGFRYEVARKYGIQMGLDVAFGPDNTAVYVQVGSAWARP
jgi:Omp85 superfamily domain